MERDANGNTTADGTHTYGVNSHNRLVSVDSNITYTYNALGQRVSKTVNGVITTYVYDTVGQLLGEYQNGSPVAEYITLNGQPLAVIQYQTGQGTLHYVHTDHLGTPRAISDANQTVVWRWESDPFGTAAANDDPDGDGTVFTYNPRFPGQYYDAETGLHYNYFRYYDPSTGRYITSDPIGLRGGLNTYGYVEANPIKFTDPRGLAVIEIPLPDAPVWVPEWVKVAGSRALFWLAAMTMLTGDERIDKCKPCRDNWIEEVERCEVWRGKGPKDDPDRWYRACKDRAADRMRLCRGNGGTIPPDAPGEWSPADVGD